MPNQEPWIVQNAPRTYVYEHTSAQGNNKLGALPVWPQHPQLSNLNKAKIVFFGGVALGSRKKTANRDDVETLVRSVAAGTSPPRAADSRSDASGGRTDACTLSKLQLPRSIDEQIDGSLSTYEKWGINVVELGSPEPFLHPATGAAPVAQAQHSIRSTFPGSTTFKALCNSYLRKLLRGQAPDALYWVASATLPNGERVLARLRLTVVVEDISVEKQPAGMRAAANIELASGAPVQPKS